LQNYILQLVDRVADADASDNAQGGLQATQLDETPDSYLIASNHSLSSTHDTSSHPWQTFDLNAATPISLLKKEQTQVVHDPL
jgi:hypothetical protein